MGMQTEACLVLCAAALMSAGACASPSEAMDAVAKLDTQFQAAVKTHDVQVMERILHKDMVLVHGNGTTDTRVELLREARDKTPAYERQEEDPNTRTVRVWGDTAVVTARLWVKGVRHDGSTFDRRVWFSDTYVRTADGWRYVFGQVSLQLPAETGAVDRTGQCGDGRSVGHVWVGCDRGCARFHTGKGLSGKI
jgi:ketosteroid isomerase-like protein